MSKRIDYSKDFVSFYRELCVVEGAYGPKPVIPPFLETWLHTAFPLPDGNPACRNIADFRVKKQGKSGLAGAVVLYMASRSLYAECVIVASDKDQAKDRVLRSVKYAVERGPLAEHAKVYRDVIELDNRSIIQAMPADWQGAAGGNFACIIFDELHSWVYENQRRLFDELVIPPTQPSGVRWLASYAGWENESELLREWWNRALAGERINNELPFYRNGEASFLAFIDTGPEAWRMPWMSEKYTNEMRASERPNTFRRIWLNEWTSNESQFLPEGVWEACQSADVVPLGAADNRRMVLGADASTTRDITALVGVFPNGATNTSDVIFARFWKPIRGALRGGKPTVDIEQTIGEEVLRLHSAGLVAAVVVDPFQLHTCILNWQRAGISVIELPQNAGRVESDQALYDALIARRIRHYGEPTLTEHVRNAVAVETARGLRIAKEKTSLKIDGCVALAMAAYGAMGQGVYVPLIDNSRLEQSSKWGFGDEDEDGKRGRGWVPGWTHKY